MNGVLLISQTRKSHDIKALNEMFKLMVKGVMVEVHLQKL